MADVQQLLAAVAGRVSGSAPVRRHRADVDVQALAVVVGWAIAGTALCVGMIAAAALGDALAGARGRHVGLVTVFALFVACCWGMSANLLRYYVLRRRRPTPARGLLRTRNLDLLAFGLFAAPVLLLLR
jgi:uncharacterized membrane protein